MDNFKTVEKGVETGQSGRLSDVGGISLNKTIYRTYEYFRDFVINFRPRCFERRTGSEIDDRSHVYSIGKVDTIRKTDCMVGGLIHVYLMTDTLPGLKSDLYVHVPTSMNRNTQ